MITYVHIYKDAMILGKKKIDGRNFNTKMPKKGGIWYMHTRKESSNARERARASTFTRTLTHTHSHSQ